MTSTQGMVGLGDSRKPSSRVLQPPGGGSSDIFGPSAANKPPKNVKNHMESNVFKEPCQSTAPPKTKKEDTHSNLFGLDESSRPKETAIPRGQESAYDPIKGTDYPDCIGAACKTHNEDDNTENTDKGTSGNPITWSNDNSAASQEPCHTRIMQPPGGHTQGLW